MLLFSLADSSFWNKQTIKYVNYPHWGCPRLETTLVIRAFKIRVKTKNIAEFGYMCKIWKNDKTTIEKNCTELITELITSVTSIHWIESFLWRVWKFSRKCTQPSYCVLVSDGLDGKTINNTATKLLLKFCPKLKIEFFLSEAKLQQTVNFYDVSKVTIRLFYRYF